MKKLYRKYIQFLENFPADNHYFKTWVAEHYVMRGKEKFISTIKWTKEQQSTFDTFWISNYKKITNKGNKFYEAFNDQFNIEYISDFLFATKIESKLNSYNYSKIFSDKALLDILYKHRSCALLPETVILNSEGILYNADRHIINQEDAKQLLQKQQVVVIKPTVGGNSGKGIILANLDEEGLDVNQNFNILDFFSDENKNFIIQKKIEQSGELNELYPTSINTFRVITFIANDSVQLAPISLRIGCGGSFLDNIHAGGITVGVDTDNGCLMKKAYQLGYTNTKTIMLKHPDTNVIFENFKITGLDKVITAAKRLHEFTPNTRIISWDFTINHDYEPLLIEANYLGQSAWFNQITTGKSLFGNHITSILNLLK
ncbi:sugar-transfer associated ATP-grasp domain-containing protein [Kaistella antarctica]|uniref:Alpha-L-glutamate ligase homolog n=1 Tax=Kaistella antarctica TaxID=266748 RepID=A0A3S4YT81_9FLAO|nr:sugar-transfer associated ATP-grasp domain-containing protein [Kaistella antarctica]KEY18785.1 hypothetical protein HY04_09945 [Kaistella antarctica]SEW15452.1 Sugar-transfer associated ATP-grasp [Kaistella antarctica]VEH99513.1 alpha-L-glutamate ligase homolog [Kaistella antarctica]